MKAVVIGAGAVGLCSALELARSGFEVTVLESRQVGKGASHGNAGWIAPALSQPFNAPHAVRGALHSMVTSDGAVRLAMLPTAELAAWTRMFYACCRGQNSADSLKAITRLASAAADDYTELHESVAFEMRRQGLLVAFLSSESADAFERSHREVAAAGYGGEVARLTSDELHELEPMLSPRLTGLHLSSEMSVLPSSLISGLCQQFEERGGVVVENCPVTSIRHCTNGWTVVTPAASFSAEKVIVAAGYASRKLVSQYADLRLIPGWGYSAMLEEREFHLSLPLKLADVRVACSPTSQGTRISGCFDIAVRRPKHARRRFTGAVLGQAARYFDGLDASGRAVQSVWAGERTCTPDSVPYIGCAPAFPSLIIASGHGTLGVTLAPTTGKAVASLARGEAPTDLLARCSVTRSFPSSRAGTMRSDSIGRGGSRD